MKWSWSKNISNLFMAGRNISATKLGMCSTRIIGCCAIGGQAVGAAAALCTKYCCTPRGLAPHISELQQVLLGHDHFIPGFVNQDALDLARTATFTATSFKQGRHGAIHGTVLLQRLHNISHRQQDAPK